MSTKTGYKTALQQQYRIHQGTHAFMKLTLSADQESVEEIIIRCTSHLNEELQLKSIFYVDDDKGFVLQQYAGTSRIHFSQIEISNDDAIPESISKDEKDVLGLEEGVIATVTYYIKNNCVILVMTTFSCVFDECSLGLLAQELINVNITKTNQEEEISYLQYANWQSQLIEENKGTQKSKEKLAKHGEQWIYRIEPSNSSNYTKKYFNIDTSIQSQILQISKELELSIDTIFLTAFAICCYRLNLSKNAAFGISIKGRYFDEIQKLKGVLAKTFPFYVAMSEDITLLKLLKINQKEYEALQESHANFEEQKEDASTIQFVSTNQHNDEKCDWFSPSEPFSLRYEVSTSGLEITQAIRYDKESISEKFVEDIAITLDTILIAITKDTNSKVSTISFASSKEKSIHPEKEYSKPKHQTLDALFQEVFKANQNQIAISDEIATFLYQDLASMVSQVAHFISPFTQNNGEGIAVMLDQKVDLPAILLGVWMRGAYYIPIPSDCPEERLKEILKDSEAKALITNRLDIGTMEIPVVHWSLNMWNKSWIQEPKWEQRTATSVAYMIYTSGTSGKPKGVKVPDSALINYTHWLKEHFTIEKGTVSSMLSSYAFDLVYTAFWGALCNGAQICIPSSELVLNAEKLVNHIVDEKLTFVKLTPSHLKIIKEARNLNYLKESSLAYLFLGGEPIQLEDVKLLKKLVPDCKIINHYGPTETTIGVVFTELPDDLDTYTQQPWIGKPIANTKAFILNEESKPLGIGQIGELSISGDCVSLGYHNSEELNEEKFTEVLDNGVTSTIYKTGDLAYQNHQNQIVLLGRSDGQVKINGHRIEPKEIQQTILNLSETVEDCHVQVIEINQRQRLLAFIKGNLDEELQLSLKKRLPEYMIPEFVFIQTFPLTGNGKIDSKSLISSYLEKSEQKEIIQPETDLEREFSLIWKEVLGVENISVTENFFELGGDSIRAIQLISRLIKKGYKLEVRDLFEFAEVRSLAAYYESSSQTAGEKKKVTPKKEAFPLSPLQEGMFFLSLTADKKSHFIQRQFQFRGDFNAERFSEVIQEACKAFPILKARFFMSENQIPNQEFVEDRKIPIQNHQLQGQTKKAQLKAIERIKEEQLNKGVDLSVDPLFTVNIWQTSANTYELLLSYHHIILDGWCFQILASKIVEAYYTGEPISNDGAPPYSKFIEFIQSRKQEKDLKFWENYLYEYCGTTQLKDYLSQSDQEVGYKHATLEGIVSSKSFSALKDFCRLHRLTQGFVLQQIWGVLLAKYTSREDVVFATTVSGRPPELEGSENMVGLFINTLPYRVLFEPETSFVAWLKNKSLDYPDWLSNQFVRLSDIQSLTSSKENLVKHLFVLENYPIRTSNTTEGDNLDLEIEQTAGEIHLNYDLSLVLYPEDDLKIQWIYNENAYNADFVQQLNIHFELLIQQLVNTPEIRLKHLKLTENIAIPESIHIPEENGASQFLERIEQNLDKYKDKVAVKTDLKILTYQELDEQSNQVKSALLSAFSKGAAIGIYMTPNTDLVLAILGALRAGITYVPLDPKQARLRLLNIVDDAQIQGILSEEKLTQKATELFDSQAVFTLNSLIKETTENVKSVVVNNEDEVYRIFTSGSTGRPKGCCIQHKNLFHLFSGTDNHFEFSSEDCWIMLHSFGFDFSVWEIWGAIWSGASVYIPEANMARNPKKLKNILAKEKITILNSTPGAFYALIDTDDKNKNPWEETIRYVVFGGDKLEPHRFQEWYNSKSLDHLKLINMYGITETTVHNTFKEISSDDIHFIKNLSPIGTPFTGVKMYCFDSYFNELPVGIVGELFIGGRGVSKGYHQQPELSEKVFLQHPEDENSMLYRSGDLGFRGSDDEYYYMGRKDHQVQIRGFRIELEEIKKAFLQHPGIKDVGLIKKDGKVIEEDRIEAFFTLKDDEERLDISELRLFLGDRISWYMIPAVFTCVNEIPLTANGKFDPSAIVEVQKDKKTKQQHASYTEYEIIRVWEQLFNTTNIGLDDDFFDLGGNSLLAIKFITKLNKEGQFNIDVGEVFRQRTIRLLAASIDSSDTSQFTSPYQVFNSGKSKKVFFFPPALAFGFVFGRLASELKDYEIITFNYIDEGDTILQYTNIMHELQPTGDFVLAGFSSGGSLAFEVAKALEKKDREVSDIILLDSKMNKVTDVLSNEQCSEIADHFLKDPRANQYISGKVQKKLMWETIRKCAKFIHSLENTGIINTQIHLITSENNHENKDRIENWNDATKRQLKTYKGKGKHDEMLDPQNFEHNKDYFASILSN